MTNPYAATYPLNKSFDISSNPGANYQVQLVDSLGDSVVTFQTGMNSAYDMRFCDDEDNKLTFKVISTSGATETDDFEAVVWVKLASGTASQIIFNWGNESATDGSSDDIYDFVDRFPGSTLDGAKWSGTVNTVTYSIDSGVVITDATKDGVTYWLSDNTKSGSQVQSTWSPVSSFLIEYSLEISNTSATQMGMGGIALVGSDNLVSAYNPLADLNVGLSDSKLAYSFVEGTAEPVSSITPASQTRNFRIIKNGTTVTTYQKQTTDTEWTQRTTGTTEDVSKIAIAAGAYGSNPYLTYIKLTDLTIRKYSETVPYFTESPSESTIYQILDYNEDTIMFQKPGVETAQPVQILSNAGTLVTDTLTAPTAYYSLNGGARVVWENPTISGFDMYMTRHMLTVPTSLNGVTFTNGDALEISIVDALGVGHMMVYFFNPDTFATASNLDTVDGIVDGIKAVTDTLTNDYFETRAATALEGYNVSTLTAQQVWEYVTRTLTSAGAGGATAQEVWEYATRTLTSGGTATSGGSESIITGYTHVASARTIDTGDTALTVEQIISIFNLSQGCEIYNCLNPRKHRMFLTAPDNEGIDITVTNGVITYIEDSGMTNDDKLMIIVRSAHTTT